MIDHKVNQGTPVFYVLEDGEIKTGIFTYRELHGNRYDVRNGWKYKTSNLVKLENIFLTYEEAEIESERKILIHL